MTEMSLMALYLAVRTSCLQCTGSLHRTAWKSELSTITTIWRRSERTTGWKMLISEVGVATATVPPPQASMERKTARANMWPSQMSWLRANTPLTARKPAMCATGMRYVTGVRRTTFKTGSTKTSRNPLRIQVTMCWTNSRLRLSIRNSRKTTFL